MIYIYYTDKRIDGETKFLNRKNILEKYLPKMKIKYNENDDVLSIFIDIYEKVIIERGIMKYGYYRGRSYRKMENIPLNLDDDIICELLRIMYEDLYDENIHYFSVKDESIYTELKNKYGDDIKDYYNLDGIYIIKMNNSIITAKKYYFIKQEEEEINNSVKIYFENTLTNEFDELTELKKSKTDIIKIKVLDNIIFILFGTHFIEKIHFIEKNDNDNIFDLIKNFYKNELHYSFITIHEHQNINPDLFHNPIIDSVIKTEDKLIILRLNEKNMKLHCDIDFIKK